MSKMERADSGGVRPMDTSSDEFTPGEPWWCFVLPVVVIV